MRTLPVIALILSWAVVGCESFPTLPPEKNKAATLVVLAEVCSTYSSALRVLTPMRAAGRLSDAESAQVNEANEVVASVCAPDAPVPEAPLDAISQVNSKIAELLLMRERKAG